jgi:hypothetical protein
VQFQKAIIPSPIIVAEVREERQVDGGTDGGTNATERKMDDHWRRNEQLEVEEERTRVLLI